MGATQVCNLVKGECQRNLVSIQEVENKDELKIENILVVQEYPKVLLEKLPRSTPNETLILELS